MIKKTFEAAGDCTTPWLEAGKWLAKTGLDEDKCHIDSYRENRWAGSLYTVSITYGEEVSFNILMEFINDKKVYLTNPDRCDYYFEGFIDGHEYKLYVKKHSTGSDDGET